ncbi:dolichyldiphosphatase 1-like [Gigantopelta aegis]|uniref:dolichyldiphosphatase 1-like n=1 Tax=Gigantopelta aegis TaxID=1735272 RepID=UPI001B88BF65|nr:dolichyldiphosphatase 1-like [Gigantopelta aegis]
MMAGDDVVPPGHDDVVKQWVAVSLTHVEYPKGDLIGQGLAWFSLLPFCIIVAFITLIIFRRDLHTMCFLTGLLLDEAVNWVLKHVIREQRPITERVLYTEYGMPSSHAQFMWFFSIYLTFFLFIRVYTNYTWVDDLWKYAVSLGSFIISIIVCYSRIYLGYHTISQVFWGAASGFVLGVCWFGVVQLLLTPLFPHIASCHLGEFFMVRDSTLIPHVLWFEYTSSRTEARSRQRKMTARKSQ